MVTKTTRKATTTAGMATVGPEIDAVYLLKGRGKTRVYYAQFPATVAAAPGANVLLHTSYKGHQRGTLVEMVGTADGMQVWSFDQVKLTPDERAENNRLKAIHQAEYWASDKGKTTAEKIAARMEKTETEKVPPVDQVAAAMQIATATPAISTATVDRVALIADLKAAGFTLTDIMAELANMAPVNVAPANVAPTATVLAPRIIKPFAATVAPVLPTASGKPRVDCPSCGKHVDRLFHHAQAAADVCNACMSLDADTVKVRMTRRASK